MNKAFYLGVVLISTSVAQDPYRFYSEDQISHVTSPNQNNDGISYVSSQKTRVIFQDGLDQSSSLEQTSGTIQLDPEENIDAQVMAKLRYPVKLTGEIESPRLDYKSSYAIITDSFLTFTEYPFYAQGSYSWAKGVSLNQNVRRAFFNGLNLITFNIENGLTMMIAMGDKLPVIDQKFLNKSLGALAESDETILPLTLPLFTLSTQNLKLANTGNSDLQSAFISTRYQIPAGTEFIRNNAGPDAVTVDHYFSFALYNPHTRGVYLQGLVNSATDLDSTPSSYLDYVPGATLVSSALRWMGL